MPRCGTPSSRLSVELDLPAFRMLEIRDGRWALLE
jgi:hypothetical protein